MSVVVAQTGVQTGFSVAGEEVRSLMATVVGQMIAIVRTIISYLMDTVNRVTAWIGEHPLATLLMIANICIWVS